MNTKKMMPRNRGKARNKSKPNAARRIKFAWAEFLPRAVRQWRAANCATDCSHAPYTGVPSKGPAERIRKRTCSKCASRRVQKLERRPEMDPCRGKPQLEESSLNMQVHRARHAPAARRVEKSRRLALDPLQHMTATTNARHTIETTLPFRCCTCIHMYKQHLHRHFPAWAKATQTITYGPLKVPKSALDAGILVGALCA